METKNKSKQTTEWVPTTCNGCFPSCGILVRRKNGKIIGSKGDPNAFSSKGKCCGKSMSRIADLYQPGRLTRPLLRTNPEKGIGIDPKWKEISWEEALDRVVEKLDKIRKEDPRKLSLATFDAVSHVFHFAFMTAFGTPNTIWNGSTFCGAGLHAVSMVTQGSCGNSEPDTERCNYLVQWGAQYGMGANNNPMVAMRQMADARKRGARLVVIDPICSHAAAKADEWIPIIPGTDGALGLGVANLLVNELGLIDLAYLRKYTNAPYLTGDDGHYIRDESSGKPLVWDFSNSCALPYDEAESETLSLEGEFDVSGKKGIPAFALLREHLKSYTVSKVSAITAVPEDTIRRFAREFGEAAQIGAHFDYRGHTLPLRPACIETKSGGSRHKNGFWNVYSILLPNILVGSMNMPGGLLGTGVYGPFGMGGIETARDGLIMWSLIEAMDIMGACRPYPPREVTSPENIDLRELIPCSFFSSTLPILTSLNPEKARLPYQPEALIISRFNPMMSTFNPGVVAEMLKKLNFVLSFAIHHDETTEFADLVIPETHDYERWTLFPANTLTAFVNAGPGPWEGQIFQPVVNPPEGVRDFPEFMMDVMERLGLLPDVNTWINRKSGLENSPQLSLSPEKKYSTREICEKTIRLLKQNTDQDQTFRETSAMALYEKTVEESFPAVFTDARIPLYFEHFIDTGKTVEKRTHELGMDWWDISHYHPLPEWHPCPAHETEDSEFDLFLANSKLPLHGQTHSSDNAWVDDISRRNPLDYAVLLHSSAAKKKGISDGDLVWVESDVGRIKGKVRVTECVHPGVVGTFATLGRWSRNAAIGAGKGVHFNSLINLDWDRVDTLSGQIDFCARVKIYKA